jgi:hypothetical protein
MKPGGNARSASPCAAAELPCGFGVEPSAGSSVVAASAAAPATFANVRLETFLLKGQSLPLFLMVIETEPRAVASGSVLRLTARSM